MDYDLQKLSLRLLEAIEQSPYDQGDVAELSDIPEDDLANYLEGRECPNALEAVRLADVCGVSLVWLLAGKGKMTPFENTPEDHPAMSLEDEIEEFGI